MKMIFSRWKKQRGEELLDASISLLNQISRGLKLEDGISALLSLIDERKMISFWIAPSSFISPSLKTISIDPTSILSPELWDKEKLDLLELDSKLREKIDAIYLFPTTFGVLGILGKKKRMERKELQQFSEVISLIINWKIGSNEIGKLWSHELNNPLAILSLANQSMRRSIKKQAKGQVRLMAYSALIEKMVIRISKVIRLIDQAEEHSGFLGAKVEQSQRHEEIKSTLTYQKYGPERRREDLQKSA